MDLSYAERAEHNHEFEQHESHCRACGSGHAGLAEPISHVARGAIDGYLGRVAAGITWVMNDE